MPYLKKVIYNYPLSGEQFYKNLMGISIISSY